MINLLRCLLNVSEKEICKENVDKQLIIIIHYYY